MVAITGNVPSALIGKDAFQEIDINGITLPMTKHNYLVRDARRAAPRLRRGVPHRPHRPSGPGPHRHHQGRPPAGDAGASTPREAEVIAGLPGFRPNMDGNHRQLKVAAAEIAQARRPVILAGHGVLHARAWDDLLAFAEKTQIPVAHTLLGVGAIPEDHPLSYGFMGMHGWKHVNRAIQSADLLIALGMRFDDRVTGNVRTYAPYARIVHVDIDPAEIGKNVAVECRSSATSGGSCGRCSRWSSGRPADRAAYLAELADWRRESESSRWHGSGAWRDGVLSADYVISRIGDLTDHRATYVADVGQNQMWLARYAGFRLPNSTSGRAAWARWALPCRPRWAPPSGPRSARPGRSRATAASR